MQTHTPEGREREKKTLGSYIALKISLFWGGGEPKSPSYVCSGQGNIDNAQSITGTKSTLP